MFLVVWSRFTERIIVSMSTLPEGEWFIGLSLYLRGKLKPEPLTIFKFSYRRITSSLALMIEFRFVHHTHIFLGMFLYLLPPPGSSG